jgi:heme A synthase
MFDYTGVVEASAIVPAIVITLLVSYNNKLYPKGKEYLLNWTVVTLGLFFLSIILGILECFVSVLTLSVSLVVLLFVIYERFGELEKTPPLSP